MNNSTEKKISVQNVRVKYIRPKYKNLEKWCEDPDNVYIGRAGIVFVPKDKGSVRFPSKSSIWANPYKVRGSRTRDESIRMYEAYIRKKIKEDPDKYDLKLLKGKCLGCWCKPEACHGDVLRKLCMEKFGDFV